MPANTPPGIEGGAAARLSPPPTGPLIPSRLPHATTHDRAAKIAKGYGALRSGGMSTVSAEILRPFARDLHSPRRGPGGLHGDRNMTRGSGHQGPMDLRYTSWQSAARYREHGEVFLEKANRAVQREPI